MSGEAVATTVREFYEHLPFNMFGDVDEQSAFIRSKDVIKEQFPILVQHLTFGKAVLDVGCGTGWLANNIQKNSFCRVTGLDFNPVAIERAEETAKKNNLKTRFVAANLFEFEPADRFDVAVSFGALHHTHDCPGAVTRVLQRFLKPGGVAFIGLYHLYGRAPFLEHFRRLREQGVAETELFERFKVLHADVAGDETLARSWFRDQVLHPHESQHTMAEMWEIVAAAGGRITACSINDFNPIAEPTAIFEAENRLADEGEQAQRSNRYYPGFFYFLAEMP